jgi:multiple sugar transport system ATP-binding protein
MATLTLEELNLTYPDGTRAVKDVDLEVREGEFCVFLGPSGCGKTSTLRMVAGLETPTSGQIRLDNRVINNLYPGERDIAMVFQHYALYPNRTVRDHFEFPLKAQRVGKSERQRRIHEIAELLRMTDLLDAKPRQLSGGQAQRTAIGRALIRQPKLFLLDEPLTSLDATLRLETRTALKRLQQDLGITTVYVTHDQEEALSLADRIMIMHDGRVQQFASPQDLYSQPANLFVAGFVGTPAMNLLSGSALGDTISSGAFALPLPTTAGIIEGEPVVAGVRPEDLLIAPRPEGGGGPIGQIVVVEPQGDERIVSVSLEGVPGTVIWKSRAPATAEGVAFELGERVSLGIKPGGLRLFNGASQQRIV